MTTSNETRTTRRTFLSLVVLPGISAALGTSACSDSNVNGSQSDAGIDAGTVDASVDAPDGLDVAALVAAYFGDVPIESVQAIGRSYMREFRDEAAFDADMNTLLNPVASTDSIDDAVAVVEELVAGDFDANRVHLLEGWTIAPSELRMCVLAESIA